MYDRENRFCQEDFDELKAAVATEAGTDEVPLLEALEASAEVHELADEAAEVTLAVAADEAVALADAGDTEGADEVAEAEAASKRSGINGVPTFVINGRPTFSGAQRAELMLAHMLDAVGPS